MHPYSNSLVFDMLRSQYLTGMESIDMLKSSRSNIMLAPEALHPQNELNYENLLCGSWSNTTFVLSNDTISVP